MKHLMTAAFALTLLSGTSALAQPPESGAHREGGQGGGHAGPPPSRPAPQAAPAAPRGPQGGGQGYQGGGRGANPGGPQNNARPGGGYQGGYQGGARGPQPGAYPGYQGGARGAQGEPHGGYQGNPAGARAGQGGVQGYQGGQRGGQGGPANQGVTRGGFQGNAGAARTGQGAAQGYQGGAHGGRGVPNNYNPRFGAPGFRPGGSARPQYNAQYFPRVFNPDRRYAWRDGEWRGQPGYYYRHWGYGDRLPYGWFAAQWFIDDYYDYDLPVPPYGFEWVRVGPDALLVNVEDGEVVESVYGIFY